MNPFNTFVIVEMLNASLCPTLDFSCIRTKQGDMLLQAIYVQIMWLKCMFQWKCGDFHHFVFSKVVWECIETWNFATHTNSVSNKYLNSICYSYTLDDTRQVYRTAYILRTLDGTNSNMKWSVHHWSVN